MNTVHRQASHAKRRWAADSTIALRTLECHAPPDQAVATDIMIVLRCAFDALAGGTSDCTQFDALAAAINVGMIRAEAIDPLLEQVMVRAADAMRECDDIFGRHQRYGFTGLGRQSVLDALDAYEQILRLSTPAQMIAATHAAKRRRLAQMQAAA